MNIRQAAIEGGRAALAAFGLPSQPSLTSVGVKLPSIPGVPKPGAESSLPSNGPSASGASTLGKMAFNVGLGASTSSDGAGASPGEPADSGRRQRSVIDRAFQRNEDDFATSSMPEPGSVAP